MARGWESKSVEEQMAQQAEQTASGPDGKAAMHAAEADRKRQRQALELQRERILSERTSSAHRREALSQALAAIEEKLAELGWSIHV